MTPSDKSSAFARILKYTRAKSPKYVTYGLALLGIAALYPNFKFPPELAAVAGGVGVEAIGILLDRMSGKDKEDEEKVLELTQMAESIVEQIDIANLVKAEDFATAYETMSNSLNKISKQNQALYNMVKDLTSEIKTLPIGEEGLKREVSILLSLRGYKVESNVSINGNFFQLTAKKDDPLDRLCFIIECFRTSSKITQADIKQKATILLDISDSRYLFKLLIISTAGFTTDAFQFASTRANIVLMTIEELENQLVNFAHYGEAYIHDYEDSLGIFKEGRLYQHYVELSVSDPDGTSYPITGAFYNWLGDISNQLLFILGDFGSGKTSFSRRIVYKMLHDKYRKQIYQSFIPLLVNLRDYRKNFDIKHVITDTLVNQYGVEFPSFSAFERMCSDGKLILILDGFDEMADKSDRQTLLEMFGQIYLLTSLNAKVMLTCRANFFQSHQAIIEGLKNISLEIPVAVESEAFLAQLSFEGQGKILYVNPLDSLQIYEFITKRFGDEAKAIVSQIEAIHDLSDLSTRPVLLDMILSTLPALVREGSHVNSASLYEHYTNKWSGRDEWRIYTALDVRQSFCETLAWALHTSSQTDSYEIPYIVLEGAIDIILSGLPDIRPIKENLKNDIKTCSFLVRIGQGDIFRFAHKSFIEYFVARKIIKAILGDKQIEVNTLGIAPQNPDASTTFQTTLAKLIRDSYDTDTVFRLPSNFPFRYLEWTHFAINNSKTNLLNKYNVDVELEDYIERKLSDIFARQESIYISEEIATFAIEYLESTSLTIKDILEGELNTPMLEYICDILRLNKSRQFVIKNREYIVESIKNKNNEALKVALYTSLINCTEIVDIKFIWSSREYIEQSSWSYILFNLARNKSYPLEILEECLKLESLRLIEKAICAYGIQIRQPNKKNEAVTRELLFELFTSKNSEDNNLGIVLLPYIELPSIDILKFITEIYKVTHDINLVIQTLSVLEGFTFDEKQSLKKFIFDEQSLKKLRALTLKIDDEALRKAIHDFEARVRSNSEQRRNKTRRKFGNQEVLREKIWQMLKK